VARLSWGLGVLMDQTSLSQEGATAGDGAIPAAGAAHREARRGGGVPPGLRNRVFFALAVGALIDALLLMAGAPVHAVGLVAPPVAAGVITTAGEILLLLFGVRRLAAWLPAAFVAGTTLTSIVMLAPTMLLQWSAQSAFVAWCAVVLLAATALRCRWSEAPAVSWHDAAIAALIAVFVGFFCRHFAGALPTLMRTDILPTWLDYFAHGTTIASFGSPLAIHVGDIMLPGAPRVFYHYGPFMLPAALSDVSGLSGLGLATAILLPLGMFVGLCGLFVLAAELAGVGVALMAVWLVACLPDASHYWLGNGFFGFHWMLFTAPGSAFAIGAAAVAYACAVIWFETRRTGPLMLAGLLTLMLVMMRMHMFMLMVPTLLAAVVLALLPPWRTRVFCGGVGVAAALTVALVAGLLGPGLLQFTKPAAYVTFAFTNGPDIVVAVLRQFGKVGGTLLGGLLLLPATLGIWTLALPAAVLAEARAGRLRPADYVPGLMCIVYLLLIFWAPEASNSDVTEYKQRHFALLYATVGVWTAVRLLGLLGFGWLLTGWRPGRAALAVGIGCLATLFAYRHVDAARPREIMGWASNFYNTRVEPGIPQAAGFLRTHVAPGDMMLVGGGGAKGGLSGAVLELVSMTDMPSYVGRIEQVVATRSPEIVALVKGRAADIAAVDGAANRQAALALLRARGVRWYVTVAPDLPAWDRDGAQATYHVGTVYLYDASAKPGPTLPGRQS
jgi:hypothetical protein